MVVFGTLAKKIICLVVVVHTSQAINLGLIAGDLKPLKNPLSIKKYSNKSPICININSKPYLLPPLPPITLPKLPSKPPPLLKPLLTSKLSKLKSPRFPKPLLPFIPPILPIIPKLPRPLPLLPLIPPILPPILPIILPKMPLPLTNPLGPLKVPILGRKPLLKALSSEIKPVVLPPPSKIKDNIIEKLWDLKKKGHLTTKEFIRLKKLLLS